MKKTLIFCLTIGVVLLGFSTIPGWTAEPANVLKIGNITPWSGAGAPYSKIIINQGVKPYMQMINTKGGVKVGGKLYKLELITEDDKFTADGGRSAAEKLLFQDKVKFMVSNLAPASNQAVAPLAMENKVLMIVGGSQPLVRPEWPYFFETNPSLEQRMEGLASAAKKKYPQLKKIALLNPDDVTGLSMQKIAPKFLQKFDLETVYNERHPRNAKDYYPFFTKMLVQKPEIFMSISSAGDFAQMVKQVRELGFKGPMLYLSTLADLESFLKVAGEKASQGILGWYDDYYAPSANPKMREFQEFYTKVWKGWPQDIHLTPYVTCLEVLVQAFEKADTFDPDKVKQTLETSEFDTMVGKVRFGGKQTYGIGHRLSFIFRVGELKGRGFVHAGETFLKEP